MSAVERRKEYQLTSLAEVKAVFGENWPGFFNNFSQWFPALNEGSIADRRGFLKKSGRLDLPFSSFVASNAEFFSEMFLQQTPRKFFKTIDRIARELNITPVAIRSLKELKAEAGSDELDCWYFEQLQELIAPVYFRLREMGYGHWELTM